MDSVILYTEKITSRLRYTANLILKDYLGLNLRFTSDKIEFVNFSGVKILYSDKSDNADVCFVCKSNLLIETGIKSQNIAIGSWNGVLTLFNSSASATDQTIPFDIFSAVFYLVSRYEEYLPHIKDKFGRFEAESSIAFTHGFLDTPVVNYWIMYFSEAIKSKFPEVRFKPVDYEFISTIDIDNAFAFKNKGAMRTLGGYLRGFLNLNWKNITDRTKVILGKSLDPFDSYEYQLMIQKKYQFRVVYFFLLGDYGVNDKNLPSNNLKFRSLIQHLSDFAEIGIHPSFGSTGNVNQVKKEITRLAKISHKDIKSSRQHFSILSFPSTYQILLENEIQHDFSMGYHNHPGFRAGISSAFYWYDLENEIESNLKIYPFVFSESCLKYNLKFNPVEALEFSKNFIQKIKDTNGVFVSMFHNESLGEYGEWVGWKTFYEEMVKEAILK